MAYRNARGEAISAAEWSAIDEQLVSAYRLLKQGIAART
jgi:hypothetical protein